MPANMETPPAKSDSLERNGLKRNTRVETSGVEGRLDVGDAVAVEAGGGDGLGEDDANRHEDGAAAGSEWHGDFDARAFRILVAAAEAEAAFG